MSNRHEADASDHVVLTDYEAPELTEIGEASDVVRGFPGGGFDGPCGLSEPQFEFEPDGEDR